MKSTFFSRPWIYVAAIGCLGVCGCGHLRQDLVAQTEPAHAEVASAPAREQDLQELEGRGAEPAELVAADSKLPLTKVSNPYGRVPTGGFPPPQAGYVPQAGYPQAGYPQAGYPQAGYPQAGYPQAYAAAPPVYQPPVQQPPAHATAPPSLPPSAWTGAAPSLTHYGPIPVAPLGPACPPLPPPQIVAPAPVKKYENGGNRGAWKPDGIAGPWPRDEYLFDGGDRRSPVHVNKDWKVRGLEQEDTVIHYDTMKGEVEFQATNRVPIYAPRFASVRKIDGLLAHQQRASLKGYENPVGPNSQDTLQGPQGHVQRQQANRYLATKGTQRIRERLGGLGVTNVHRLQGLENGFQPYEDFQMIRRGIVDAQEKPVLAAHLDAALAWTDNLGVQVNISGVSAGLAKTKKNAGAVFQYDLPPGKPRVRVAKVASRREARPGDIVNFTIRFDNVGDQMVGNVTIIDNLTTRLEYVPDSAQCSVDANFITEPNDGGSLVLKWEVLEPLLVGKGGVIRFKCRVR